MSQSESTWPDKAGSQYPAELTQSSELEIWASQIFIVSDPILQVLSCLLLLIFSILLVLKTKVPGRWLIFACPAILFINLAVQKILHPSFPLALNASVMDIAFSKFTISFAFLLVH